MKLALAHSFEFTVCDVKTDQIPGQTKSDDTVVVYTEIRLMRCIQSECENKKNNLK